MKAKSSLLAFALMGAMMNTTAQTNRPAVRGSETPRTPKKIIPRGCREYHFTVDGSQVDERNNYIHFSCIASSERKAILKFEKFLRTADEK